MQMQSGQQAMFSNYRNPSFASFASTQTGSDLSLNNFSTANLSTTSFSSEFSASEFWANNPAAQSPSSLPVQSNYGIVTVLQVTPLQGEAGTRITIAIGFKQQPGRVIGLRIVFGGQNLRTLVAHGAKRGYWQLRAEVPDMTMAGSPSVHSLRIEALEGGNVIDSVDFGEFTFWAQGTCPPQPQAPSAPNRRMYKSDAAGRSSPMIQRAGSSVYNRSMTGLAAAAISAPVLPTTIENSPPMPAPVARTNLAQPDAYRIVRRTEIPIEREASALSVIMNIHGDLRAMSAGWNEDEIRCRRRLVQFWRHMEGNVVNVHFCAISPEEYDDSRIVVSCIYREDVDKCYITSFDLIRLLEGIIGTVCNIDEKNRIRRNVHHIEHDTISKSKPYHEEFFDLIMSFPTPMPRRNVRDLKAFRWEYLADALHAIIDKMALDYNPTPISDMVEPSIPEVPEPVMDEQYQAYAAEQVRSAASAMGGNEDYVDSSFEFRNPAAQPMYDPYQGNFSAASFRSNASIPNFQAARGSTGNFYGHQSPNASVGSFGHFSPNASVASFNAPPQMGQNMPSFTTKRASNSPPAGMVLDTNQMDITIGNAAPTPTTAFSHIKLEDQNMAANSYDPSQDPQHGMGLNMVNNYYTQTV